MGEISTRQRTEAPSVATPQMARLTAVLRNKIEIDGGTGHCSILSQNAPTEEERRFLVIRRVQLADGLAPKLSDIDSATDAILEMFYGWPDTRRMDAGKAAATASKYAATVSDLPLWAIVKACDQLSKEDRDFPPSAGTLRAVTLKACEPIRDELNDVKRILNAEVYTPTKRGKDAIERVKHVAASFKHRAAADQPFRASDYRQHPDAEAERQLENFNARRGREVNYDKPLFASDALLKSLNLPRATHTQTGED